MWDFKAKIHQIRFRLGLRPRPTEGACSAPPDSLAGFKGVYFCGKYLFSNIHQNSLTFMHFVHTVHSAADRRSMRARGWCKRHAKRHAWRHSSLYRQLLTEPKYVRITTDALTSASRHVLHGQWVRRVAQCVRMAANAVQRGTFDRNSL